MDKNPPPPPAQPNNWLRVVHLIQHIFQTGGIPEKLEWAVLALPPKPERGTCGIGLPEVVWKLVEAIVDTHVKKVVKLHDVLH